MSSSVLPHRALPFRFRSHKTSRRESAPRRVARRAAPRPGQARVSWRALALLVPAFLAVISLASLLLLIEMSHVTANTYMVRRLEDERNSWQQMNYQLEAYVASLQSLDRIEREARGRLGMVPAPAKQFVRVDRIPSPAPELEPPSHPKVRVPLSAEAEIGYQARQVIEQFLAQFVGGQFDLTPPDDQAS